MSFVTTKPEALEYASGKLDGIGTSLAAQNAAAAASTTNLAPAAADEVSALQATQFSAYGNLYQQVSAQATANNQAFVRMLGLSGDSYGTTEATNSAATGTSGSGGFSILGQLTQFGQFGILPGSMSEGSMDGLFAGSPFLGALSTFQSLAPTAATASTSGASAGSADLSGISLAGATAPTATAPVLAGSGQASTVGRLSVPPSWAAGTPSATGGASLTPANWTTPAEPVTNTVPGGVPSMASTGRTSAAGGPRNGIKPKVLPKSTVV
jgi:hypothetical protein